MDTEKVEKLREAIRNKGNPIRESEWMREYSLGPNHLYRESKFLKDGLEVSAASIKGRWESFTPHERSEFAHAFSAKRDLSAEGQEILRFLMEFGTELEWQSILIRLPEYVDREYALRFIMEKVNQNPGSRANYYQAMELMGDARAISTLTKWYEEYRHRLAPFEKQGPWGELGDYQSCCRALWKLSGSAEYEKALRETLTHPHEVVRQHAEVLLSM